MNSTLSRFNQSYFMKIIRISFLPVFLLLFSCDNPSIPPDIDPRQEMRDFVIGISQYGKAAKSNFVIIPQNGIELVTENGESDGSPSMAYLNAIDGHGQEDLYYGYERDDKATPANERDYLRGFLDLSRNRGNTILVTDYCSTPANMDDSYAKNNAAGFISFAADQRELNNIPDHPNMEYGVNDAFVTSLSEAKNFLYLINPENYATKLDFITAVTATNYDLLIMDLYFHDGTAFTDVEINQLKGKNNDGKRMVICYMSIGEAEDYRYYWESGWKPNNPSWIEKENPNWKGNFKVRYWEQDWQDIIYGNDNSYLKKILDAQFDGVYLDIIDAYEYFE